MLPFLLSNSICRLQLFEEVTDRMQGNRWEREKRMKMMIGIILIIIIK